MEHPEDVLAKLPSETRSDLAMAYITEVEELRRLNTECAEELRAAKEELRSMQELLANCTESNLRLQEQVAAEVRLRQQDFDRTVEP